VTYNGQKSKTTTTTKDKIKYKNPCPSRESNMGPFAQKADAYKYLSATESTERLYLSQAI